MKIVYALVLVLIFVVALLFSLINWYPVKVYFYNEIGIEMPLALALTLELLAGVAIGLLVSMIGILRLRSENGKLQQRLMQAEKEIRTLRGVAHESHL